MPNKLDHLSKLTDRHANKPIMLDLTRDVTCIRPVCDNGRYTIIHVGRNVHEVLETPAEIMALAEVKAPDGDTKGSWKWQLVTDEGCMPVWTLDGPIHVICRFWNDAPPSHEARVIEAAPELLAACLIGRDLVAEMVAQETGLRRVASSKALSIIEAAIAKTDRSGS